MQKHSVICEMDQKTNKNKQEQPTFGARVLNAVLLKILCELHVRAIRYVLAGNAYMFACVKEIIYASTSECETIKFAHLNIISLLFVFYFSFCRARWMHNNEYE